MLIVISPAKRLDWDARDVAMTEPEFLEDANRLARTMRNLTLGTLYTIAVVRPLRKRIEKKSQTTILEKFQQ